MEPNPCSLLSGAFRFALRPKFAKILQKKTEMNSSLRARGDFIQQMSVVGLVKQNKQKK
jgi:hypothetical protein